MRLSLKAPNKNNLALHLLMLPGVALMLVFHYMPLGGIVIAFKKFNPALGIIKSRWSGMDNFISIFNQEIFYRTIWNSFYLSFSKIILGLIMPLVLALLINEIMRPIFKRVIQTTLFIPYFLSWAILAGVVVEFFSLQGPINEIITALGGDAIPFLVSNKWFPGMLITTDVWKGMGINIVIFLAAITNISPELYQSSNVDGATRLQQVYYITLPGMGQILALVCLLSLGTILNAGFEQIFMLYSPPVYESSDIIDTYVYRMGIEKTQYSIAAAAGLFKSVISFILMGLSYFMAFKYTDYRVF